ncbi:MAG: CDP-glucose 4,6-dehydratase [Puniceicoccales bacterium]|jgi:CDP-glucose 4,6-dehydratase|nr:CDP-glucose 4,6-dehydratase [Puniceicoccales bacterium]
MEKQIFQGRVSDAGASLHGQNGQAPRRSVDGGSLGAEGGVAHAPPFSVYRDCDVFVTGHTGFKGAWLCEWLLLLGARVTGFALPPPTTPSLFDQLGLASRIHADLRGDVRDAGALADAIGRCKPRIVFHLAAQPLVRLSYEIPVETFSTNVLGTVHLLDAVRRSGHRCAVVVVTTDKCYENREWMHGYREDDPMGGHDPYSASKGCAELVTASWRRSFWGADSPVAVATARAGNVLGGGDWASDRIVPDAIRALAKGEPICVRNPRSTRPWQHVLEPLSAYLLLAQRLWEVLQPGCASGSAGARPSSHRPCALEGAFNFGPSLDSNRDVETLVRGILRHWPGALSLASAQNAPHEAGLLNLAIDKARHLLRWKPTWDFQQTIEKTVAWYLHCCGRAGGDFSSNSQASSEDIRSFTRRQINEFSSEFSLV